MSSPFVYPETRRDEKCLEDLHGHKVCDPYRWMEDPDAQETKDFVDRQNDLSRAYLESCELRPTINSMLTELWNYPKFSVPFKEGSRYFFFKNDGLQNQHVIYVQDTLTCEPRVFFDPNVLSTDGTISLTTYDFSYDGSIFAYGLSHSGSDWFDIHFKNVDTGEVYSEVLKKAKFSDISWTHDNKGVFYACYGQDLSEEDVGQNSGQKLYYHVMGTPQESDILVMEFPEHPLWRIKAVVSDCGNYLVTTTQQDCKDNLVFFTDLRQVGDISGKLPLTQVIFKLENDYEYVTNTGSVFVFKTNMGAPNYNLVTYDFAQPPVNGEPWPFTILLPEHEKNVLEWAVAASQDKLVLCYMEDVKNVLQVNSLATGQLLFNVPLPIGAVINISGSKKHSDVFFKWASLVNPGIIYHLDLSKEFTGLSVYKQIELKGVDPNMFEMEQVFYPSKDGTSIPMFIAYRKDRNIRDGSMPCLLYGYGGFNVSLTPSFSIKHLFFVKHFGFQAIANLRGGGEYGKTWHNSGKLLNKQNVFDDFNAAADYLIKEKFTSRSKLAIEGGSNGGLLVSACCNQNPGSYAAAVAAAGVMDMLRFHKFTIGYAWCSDYGNPDEAVHFENLLRYSPVHNVKVPENGKQYPAILVLTADHDDRVVPSHSLKFIAELQHVLGKLPQQVNPLLARIDTKAGHGQGKPTAKTIDEVTDIFAFLAKTLNLKLLN